MNWEDAKKIIKSGDLVFVSHQEWATVSDIESQIVRMVTESEYSHCAVVVVEPGGPCVIEAVVPYVSLNPLQKYLDHGFYLVQTPDKPMTDAELKFGMSKIAQPYSKVEAVEGYLDLITLGASDSWYCAELTICMRRLAGLELGPSGTPAAVARKALQLGYTVQYIQR